MESKSRRKMEAERDAFDKKLSQVRDFLLTDRCINDETRNKFAFLNESGRKRKSKSIGGKYGNDINSTGSFLSDLSVTQSEEDFLDISKPFKKHRPSQDADGLLPRRSARKSGRKSMLGEQRSRSK